MTAKNKDPFAELLSFTAANGTNINNNIGISNTNNNNNSSLSLDEQRRRAAAAPSQTLNPNPILNANVAPIMASGNYSPHSRQSSNYASRDSGSTFQSNLDSFSVSNPIQSNLQYSANGTANNIGFSTLAPPSPLQSRSNSSQYSYQSTTLTPPISNPSKTGNKNRDAFADLLVEARSPSGKPGNFTISSSTGNNHVPLNSLASSATSTNTFITNYPNSGTFIGSNSVNNNTFTPEQQVSQPSSYLNQQLHPQLVFSTAEIHSQKSSHADIWDFDALTSTVTTGQAPNESDPFGLGFSNSQIPNQQKQEEEEDLFAIFNKPRAPSPPPRPEITSKPISPTIQSSEIRANIPQSPRSTAITSITDMGFLRANAIAALDAAQGDVERAISFLLANNRDSSLSPDRSPPPRPPRRSNFDTAQSPNSPVTPNASAAVALATNAKNLFEFGRAKLGAAYVKASERVAAVVEGFDVGNSGGANSGTVNSSDMWDREGQNRWADNDGGSASRYRDDTSSDEEEEIHLVHRRKPVGGNAKVVQSPIISASSRQEFSGENGFRSLQSPQHQQSHTDVFAFDNIVASGTPLAASSHLNQTKSRPPQPPASRKPASLRYTATPSQRAIAATHRERGNDLFKAGQYAAADEAYSVAILTLPVDDGDLIALRNNRAAARLKIGDYVGVITDCDAVQAIDARDPKSLLRRAAAWEGRERWNEALRDYESLMRLDSSIKGVTEGLARSRKGVAEFSGDGTGVFAGRASAGGENLWISDGLAPRTTPLANQSNKPISAKAQAAVEKAVDAVRTQINVQEREDEEKFQAKEAVEAKIENWKRGKDQNIRALLSSLDSVLWAELEWKTIGLSELITPQQVKIKYMKAVAKVHPDKLKQGTTTEQKLIAQEVFSVLNTAWDSFKSAKNENFQMADNGQGTASAEQTPDAGQKEQTLAGPIRWVGPALKHSDGLWSPIQVVDATVPDDPDVDSDNDSKNDHNALVPNPLFDLTPAAIVDELGKLRTDLKLLADAFTHHRHLTKAESDSALASFFENVRSMEKEADSTSNSVATVLDHEAVLNAQKSMPHYMAILTHAAVIVQEIARNADISHPEEFLSLYHAKEIIRDIDQELSAKKKEIEVLKEKISSLEVELANATRIQPVPTSPVSKPVWRTSSPPSISIPPTFVEVVVPPSQQNGSSQSLIGGAFGYLRRASSAFIQPASKQALVVSTTDLATKNSISAPDDLYAPLIARGGWMLSKDTYDFFISYRVASDAKIAMELYFRLKDQRVVDEHGNSRHVRVYWDKECLKKGQDWHDGFVEGLKNSRCVLMIVSAGAIERMAASDKYGDNVLLEWETAVLSGEFGICIPQPVFINDPSAKSKGYDALTAFRSSDKCPKLRSMASGAHHLSAYTTLGEISKLQGINLNTEEVSWVIPDCMKALTTYIPVKSGAVAKQCHTEASFFKYFSDSKYFSGIPFESKNYFIDFLTSNDLKELFGYEAEGKEGILKYRQHLESLKLTFKDTPEMSRNSMNIICKGITGNFSFFSELDLKNSRITDKSVWSDFTSALKSNTNIQTLDLSYNDVTDVPGLFEAIRDHTGLKKVLIGSAFDPMPFLSGKSVASVTFNTIDSLGLNILVDVWAIGKPFLEKLFITKFINEKENDSAFESTISKFGAFLSALPNLKEISLPEILANAAIQCLNDSLTIVSVSLIGTGTRSTATGKKSKLAKDGSATDKKNKKKVASKKKQVAEWMDPFCKAMVKCAKSKTQKEIDLELADENGERNANVLRTLYLSDLSLDDEDMYIFAESLAEITDFAVAELNLQNNEIGADGIKDVLNAFKADNKFLTSITLASNSIGPTSATAFKNFIKNATNLTDIDLSENPIGSAFEAIADAIKSLPDCALEYATFGRTNMTDDELILLSGALTSNKNIEYLDISENEFNVAGITALGQSLFANSTLTEIVLTNSLSGPNGLESIADALKNGVCAVKDLWLEKCQIRDTGAKIILESQSGERKTLRSLMLEDNEIEGGAELCALFDQHKDLFSAGIEYLWFENNLSLSGGLLKAMGPVIVAAANFAAEAKQKEKAVDDTENVDEKGTDQDEANKEGADGDNSKESVDEEASNEDNSDEEDAKEDNSDEEDVKEDNSSDQKDATKDNSDGNSEKSANQSSSEDSEDDDDTVPKGLLNLAFTGCSKIGNDAAVEMIQLLHLLNEIEIGFDDCGLDDKIVGSVCEAISNPSAHFILNLEKNKITDEGVKTISSFAETNLNSNSIDYCIYLAGNSFTSDFSKEFSEKLEKYEIYLTGDEESVEKVFEYSEST